MRVRELAAIILVFLTLGCFLLSSRSAGIVMVLHGPTQPPAQAKHHPYALPLPRDVPSPLTSLVTLTANDDKSRLFLLGISHEGGLWSTTVGSSAFSEGLRMHRLDAVLSLAVRNKVDEQKIDDTRLRVEDEPDDVAETQHKELDLRWAWLGECEWSGRARLTLTAGINESVDDAPILDHANLASYARETDHPMTA